MKIISSFLSKWPQTDGSSRYTFWKKKWNFCSLPRNQDQTCHGSLPVKTGNRWSLFFLLHKALPDLAPGTHPASSYLAVSFPSRFKLSQWLEFFNYSKSLHTSETLHVIYFSRMLSSKHPPLHLSKPARYHRLQENCFVSTSIFGLCSWHLLLLFSRCYRLLLSTFVSSTGLWLS